MSRYQYDQQEQWAPEQFDEPQFYQEFEHLRIGDHHGGYHGQFSSAGNDPEGHYDQSGPEESDSYHDYSTVKPTRNDDHNQHLPDQDDHGHFARFASAEDSPEGHYNQSEPDESDPGDHDDTLDWSVNDPRVQSNINKHHLIYWLCHQTGLDVIGSSMEDLKDLVIADRKGDVDYIIKNSPYSLRRFAATMRFDAQGPPWCRDTHSAVLTLEDKEALIGNTIPPASTISAKFLKGAQQWNYPGVLALGFFCGLHGDGGRPFPGTVGVMRALTLQLLLSIPGREVSLMPWEKDVLEERLIENVYGNPTEGLQLICQIFDDLLFRSQANVIYVILDNTQSMEHPRQPSGGMSSVLECLLLKVELLHRMRSNKVFKLLVTNRSEVQIQDTAGTMERLSRLNAVYCA